MNNEKLFTGYIEITPPLNQKEINYLKKFSASKRLNRGNGPYFINHSIDNNDNDVIQEKNFSLFQPSLWCKWIPTEDGTKLQWNEYNNFNNPKGWMKYLIVHFLGEEPVAKLVHPEEFDFLQGHVLHGVIYYSKLENDNTTIDDHFCDHKNHCLIVVNQNKVKLTTSLEELKKREYLKKQKKLEEKNHNDMLEEISLAIQNKIEIKTAYKKQEIVLLFNGAIRKKYPLFTNIWSQTISYK